MIRYGIELKDGQSIIIYSEELEVEGIVRYSEEERLWTAVIDWDAIQEKVPIVPQPEIQDISHMVEKKMGKMYT